MEIIRKKLRENVITLEDYRVEAIMSTMQVLKTHHQLEFVNEIGLGAFGAVMELKDPELKRNVAGKIVLQEYVSDSEKDIWPLISHENLLPLMRVEHIAHADTYVFITPLHRVSLQKIVQGCELVKDPKGIERSISWLHDICSGVHHLHKESMCHLDIKMSNVLISNTDTAVICDFGSLCRTDGPTDNYLSPLLYRPPEGLQKTYGRKTTVNGYYYDIYTIGMLCLELFTSETLCKSESLADIDPRWTEHLYPRMFDILVKKEFEVLTKNAFLMSDVRRDTFCEMRDFIRGCININPRKRPSINDLMEHKIFKGEKDFKHIKNDAWTVRCEPDEVNFLVNFYIHCSVKKDVPLKDVQEFLKPSDNSEQEAFDNDSLEEKREERLARLEQLKLESSCHSTEPELVQFEPEKSKKRIFYDWIGKKKRRICNVIYRLCCCSRKTTTVRST